MATARVQPADGTAAGAARPRGHAAMRVLVYKRTHNGDPDPTGCFGIHDCMGSVRKRAFDAVIGVGGVGPQAEASGIAGKVNWIGVGPRKSATRKRGPHVRFERFHDFGTAGPSLSAVAPTLANRLYGRNVRHVMDDLSQAEYAEVLSLLKLVGGAGPSGGPAARLAAVRQARCPRNKPAVC